MWPEQNSQGEGRRFHIGNLYANRANLKITVENKPEFTNRELLVISMPHPRMYRARRSSGAEKLIPDRISSCF